MISLTIFKNQYDNKTNKRMDLQSWEDFEDLLYKLSTQPLASKREANLISPATYKPDTTRANDNVVEWGGWAAIDVDDHVFEGDLEQELKEKYGHFKFVCYSTASSTDDHPKFRLVFPLTERVEAERIKHFWFPLNTEVDGIADRQTKDLSRMYFIPADYAGANNFIFSNDGNTIDPSAIMAKHPYVDTSKAKSFFDRLPQEMQQRVLEHRKNKSMNTNVTWTSYQDCPFVSRKMITDYTMISQTGWYAKMYQMMCSIAVKAVRMNYPISSSEIATLCREIDRDTGNWYENRPLEVEANNAIEFAYRNAV